MNKSKQRWIFLLAWELIQKHLSQCKLQRPGSQKVLTATYNTWLSALPFITCSWWPKSHRRCETQVGSALLRVTCYASAHVNIVKEKIQCRFQFTFDKPWRLFGWYSYVGQQKFRAEIRGLGYCAEKTVYRLTALPLTLQILPVCMALSLHSLSLFGFCFLAWCSN